MSNNNNNQISLQHFKVLGIDRSPNTGIFILNDNNLVYFAGNNIVSHNLDSKDQKFIPYTDPSRGDIKSVAITPSSLSGISILAFSLELDGSTIYLVDIGAWKKLKPITLSGFGAVTFSALAFSSNGRFLIAYGSSDSNLYYFDVSNGSLIKEHKITSGTTNSTSTSVVTTISLSPSDHNTICCSGKGIIRQLNKSDKGFTVKQGPMTNRDQIDFKSHVWISDGKIVAASSDSLYHFQEIGRAHV